MLGVSVAMPSPSDRMLVWVNDHRMKPFPVDPMNDLHY
jgi:hypothetical protein